MSHSAHHRPREEFPRLGILSGCDTIDSIEHDRTRELAVEGNNDMAQFVVESGFKWLRFHVIPSYFEQPLRFNMKNRHLLCNIVTDPDLNPRVLKVIERIAEESGLPMLNRPERMWQTARDTCAEVLSGIPDLIVPKVIRLADPSLRRLQERMEETGFRFPALVREPGRHNGEFVGLFEKPGDLAALFEDRTKEYLLTEFVDFASPDGLYRKDRFFFIGDTIIPRHRITANVWNLHANSRKTLMAEDESLREEERLMVTGGFEGMHPTTQSVLLEIRTRLGLDYFGLDCNVRPDGEVVLFEANATTNFFPLGVSGIGAYLKPLLYGPAVAAFERLIESAAAQHPAVQAASS